MRRMTRGLVDSSSSGGIAIALLCVLSIYPVDGSLTWNKDEFSYNQRVSLPHSASCVDPPIDFRQLQVTNRTYQSTTVFTQNRPQHNPLNLPRTRGPCRPPTGRPDHF